MFGLRHFDAKMNRLDLRKRRHRSSLSRGRIHRHTTLERLEQRMMLARTELPMIGSFTIEYESQPMATVVYGQTVTLKATEVRDLDGGIAAFSFWLDVPHDGYRDGELQSEAEHPEEDYLIYDVPAGGDEFIVGTSSIFTYDIRVPNLSWQGQNWITLEPGVHTFFARVEDFEHNFSVQAVHVNVVEANAASSAGPGLNPYSVPEFFVAYTNHDDDDHDNIPDYEEAECNPLDDDIVSIRLPEIPPGFEDSVLTVTVSDPSKLRAFNPTTQIPIVLSSPIQIPLADLNLNDANEFILVEGVAPTSGTNDVIVEFTFTNGAAAITRETRLRILNREHDFVVFGTATYDSLIAIDPSRSARPIPDMRLLGTVELNGISLYSVETYTDEFGNYVFTFDDTWGFDPQDATKFRIEMWGEPKPWPGTNVMPFVFENPVNGLRIFKQTIWATDLAPDRTKRVDLRPQPNADPLGEISANEVFEAYHALMTASRYYSSLPQKQPLTVRVTFPASSVRYQDEPKTIFLTKKALTNWDVIIHEYGHWVQSIHGITQLLSGDTSHSATENLRYRGGNVDADAQDLTLAWDEGWASYFSHVAQQRQKTWQLQLQRVGDSGQDLFDMESRGTDAEGEDAEASVARILWKIADFPIAPGLPALLGDDKALWTHLVAATPVTLDELWFSLVQGQPSTTKFAYGGIFESGGVAPRELKTVYGVYGIGPALQFEVPRGRNGLLTSQGALFNKLGVHVYDTFHAGDLYSWELEVDPTLQPPPVVPEDRIQYLGTGDNGRTYIFGVHPTLDEWNTIKNNPNTVNGT